MPILICVSNMWNDIFIFNKTSIPLIKLLGNEAIEDEHWEEIKKITNIDIQNIANESGGGIYLKHALGIDVDK